jgi:truncated hemoglobin YjbI
VPWRRRASAKRCPTSRQACTGGYDAIAAVTDDFIGRMIADPQLNEFFSASAMNRRSTSGSTSWTSYRAGPQAAVKDLQATFDKF